jgi:hypothetical protein
MNRHSHRLAILPLALLLATGCGDTPPEAADAADSTATAATADPIPTTPRVMAIEVGIALDEAGRIMGGGVDRFPTADTLFVHVRTERVAEGSPLTVRVLAGDRTVHSVDVAAGAPNADALGEVTARLPAGATLGVGTYRVEVLLDGVSQGIREITITG